MSGHPGWGLGAGLIAGVLALAAGCSHKPLRVDCDKKLEPINPVTSTAYPTKPDGTGREP